MTTELAQPDHREDDARAHAPRRSGRNAMRVFVARLMLYWERMAPAMLPALGVVCALLILSFAGAWRLTPAWLHWIVLALAGAALAATLWRDVRPVRFPSRRAAQARIEKDAALVHAPLQSLDDRPSEETLRVSPLWRAHMEASRERARKARRPKARDALTTRDPYGLRYLMLALLAIAFIGAGKDWRPRIAGLLAPGAAGASAAVADLWIEPPAYTGKAPIYLMRAGDAKAALEDQVNAPQGARVVAQINGHGRRALAFRGETTQQRAAFERDDSAARAELTLLESGVLTLRLGGRSVRWPIGVSPDAPPRVVWSRAPEETETALVGFAFTARDDFGLAAARLELRLDPNQDRPVDLPEPGAAALETVRAIPLEGAGLGDQTMTVDLQADPWAGLDVLARIVVTDGAGQTGATQDAVVTLPARRFFNPLAQVVVEQRQTLAIAPEDWRRSGRSLDAVTLAPDVFFDRSKDYLLMRAAFWRVMRQNGDSFDDAVEKFWPLALQLEDDAVELARQRLEAAQEALRAAIERGADDEEITRLTEALRQAMDDYLAALEQSGEVAENSPGGDSQQIDQSSLDEMLDAIRDLAQSGAGNAARQMLSDLENILNNLRLTQGGTGGGGEGAGSPGQGPSDDAGDLIGRQRELADEAFQRGRDGEGEGAGDLAEEQSGLGDDLDELIDELQGAGGEADPNGDAARAMGRARNNMRAAEDALRQGDFDAAAGAMERAIAQMRDGAEGLAREEMRQAGEAGEQGGGGATDPLGRPVGEAYGAGVEVPEESDAARTRALINELRRRLGEPDREDEEIDYLERLLERF